MLPLTEHTSFAMDWPPNCCGRAPRSVRSASYWVTAVPRPPRSTSKWILMHCGHSPCLGREVCDEHSPRSCWGVLRDATRLGIQAAGAGQRVDQFHHVSGAAQRLLHHSGVGAGLGSTIVQRSAGAFGSTAEFRPRIRTLSQCHRSSDADSGPGLVTLPTEAGATLSVL